MCNGLKKPFLKSLSISNEILSKFGVRCTPEYQKVRGQQVSEWPDKRDNTGFGSMVILPKLTVWALGWFELWDCSPYDVQAGALAFSLKNYCGFSIDSNCCYVCEYQGCPQTLVEICRNLGIWGSSVAVAPRKIIEGHVSYPTASPIATRLDCAAVYMGSGFSQHSLLTELQATTSTGPVEHMVLTMELFWRNIDVYLHFTVSQYIEMLYSE